MRLGIGLAALALAAGCGGSSATQELAAGGASPSLAPSYEASPPAASPSPKPAHTAKPSPSGIVTLPPPRASASSGGGTSTGGTGAGGTGTSGTGAGGTATSGTATSGPGRVSSPAPSPTPRPTPTAVDGTVTVTDDNSGQTVYLAVGQHLRVRLSSGTWDPPVSSADGVVVRRSSAGGYPSSDPVDAMFDAVGPGSADVTAQSDAACFHTEPRCMMASRQWQVSVVVR